MYQYHKNSKYGLLIFRHFGDFKGAESTTALVTINRLLSKNERLSLKIIVIDFRKVLSATLYQTDRALHNLLHHKFIALPKDLRLYRLYDRENPATQTLLERLNRTQELIQQQNQSFNDPLPLINLFDEQELLTHLNLPKELKIFADDLDWQTAEYDPSLPDN